MQVKSIAECGQKYCRMLQVEHSALLLAFIKRPIVIKIFVLSNFDGYFTHGFTGLPRSGKKFWKMKIFQVREKSGNYIFSQGNFKKNDKSHGKVREFQNFPKKMLVNRLLEILVSIICKQY